MKDDTRKGVILKQRTILMGYGPVFSCIDEIELFQAVVSADYEHQTFHVPRLFYLPQARIYNFNSLAAALFFN